MVSKLHMTLTQPGGRLALATALILGMTPLRSQPAVSSPEYIAFRVDAERVLAHLRTLPNVDGPQVRTGLSPRPVAKFGYEHFDPPEYWQVAKEHSVGDRWTIHTAPGRTFDATVERNVGGYLGCQESTGVLLKVAPAQAAAFAAVRPRYFVAMPDEAQTPSPAGSPSSVRTLPASTLTPDVLRSIESILETTLARELPAVRLEFAPMLERTSSQHHYRSVRVWARRRLQIEDALEDGEGKLRYDVQPFQLAPDGIPVLFVRAEWLVGRSQGFVASLWLRAGKPMEVLETNVNPAKWARMSLFREIAPSHVGLILNVLDRNGDGWGEVLSSWEGYESRTISLREYSPAGFQPATADMSGGC